MGLAIDRLEDDGTVALGEAHVHGVAVLEAHHAELGVGDRGERHPDEDLLPDGLSGDLEVELVVGLVQGKEGAAGRLDLLRLDDTLVGALLGRGRLLGLGLLLPLEEVEDPRMGAERRCHEGGRQR